MPVIDSVNRKGIGGKRVTKGPNWLVGPKSGDIKSDFSRLSGIRGKVDQYEVTQGSGTLAGTYTFTVRPFGDKGFPAYHRAVGDVAVLKQVGGIANPGADIVCLARKHAATSTSPVTLGPFDALDGDRMWVVVENRDGSTLRYKLDVQYDVDNQATLDLRFAETKSLVDATTGSNLVTFARGTGGTYVGSDGLIKTAGVNEPRFDHDPVTGESLGLLVEENRVNYFPWSNSATDTETWNNVDSGGLSLAAGQVSPAGDTAAIRASDYNDTNAGTFLQRTGLPSLATGVTISYSAWIRPISCPNNFVSLNVFANGVADSINAIFTVSGTQITSASAQNVGTATGAAASFTAYPNGWYRCILTGSPSTVTMADTRARVNLGTYTRVSGTARFDWYGAQLELGSFATSYIPSVNASLGTTRAADVASISGSNFSSWYNQSEGTILAELRGFDSTRNGSILMLNSSTTLSDDLIDLYVSSGDAATSRVRSSGGVSAFLNSSPVLANINSGNKIAVGVQADNYALGLNGLIASSDTSGPIPTNLTIAYIGTANYTGVLPLCSSIKRITYWNRRLPDSTLQAITQ